MQIDQTWRILTTRSPNPTAEMHLVWSSTWPADEEICTPPKMAPTTNGEVEINLWVAGNLHGHDDAYKNTNKTRRQWSLYSLLFFSLFSLPNKLKKKTILHE